MNRDAATARVLDYVYGEMTPDEAEAFETVLAADAELAAEVEALRGLRKAASGLPSVHLPAEARRRILRAAHTHARMASRAFDFAGFLERLILSPGFSGALVVLVALGVGTHLLMYGGMDHEPTLTEIEVRSVAREMATARKTTAVAETREVAEAASRPAEPVAQAGASEAPAPERTAPRRPRVATAAADLLDTGGSGRFASSPSGLGILGVGKGGGGMGGGGAGIGASGGLGSRSSASAQDGVRPTFATSTVTDSVPASGSKPADGGPSAGERSASASRDDSSGKDKKKAEAMPVATAAPSPPAAPAGKSFAAEEAGDAPVANKADADGELQDARGILAKARQLRSAGKDVAALDAYGRAIASGLTGKDLEAALVEAAALARRLGREALANAYEERLSSGKKQAAPAADE